MRYLVFGLLASVFLISKVWAHSEIFPLEKEDIYVLSLKELMEIEIDSADKTSVPLKKIPASVTILTRTEIEQYGYATLPDIIRNIPGLYIQENTESLFVGVRGNTGGGLQVLVNGIIAHPSLTKGLTSTDINAFNIPVNAIDRIEVIRGPMSVIYGNNAFFGVINIITNDISQEDALASLSYGTQDSGEVFLRYGQHYDEGFFLLNIGGYKNDGPEGAYADMLSPSQLASLHPSTISRIDGQMDNEQESIQLNASYKNLEADLSFRKKVYGIYPTSVGFGDKNHLHLKTYQAALSYSDTLDENFDIKLSGIFSEEQYEIPKFSFFTPTAQANQKQNSRRNELEANLIYYNGNLEILGGYRYRSLNKIYNNFFLTFPPSATATVDTQKNMDGIQTHELFTQASYDVNEQFKLIAGLRYLRLPDSYARTITASQTGATSFEKTPINDRNQFTGRLALSYDIDDDQNIKFLVGTAAQDRDTFEFSQPGEITTYEISHHLTYDSFQLSSSLFYNNIRNIIQRYLLFDTASNSFTDISNNNGKWESYGLELIASYYISSNWRLHASTTMQKTEDKNNHVDVGYSPHFLAKLRSDYTHNSFTYALNAYYVSKMRSSYTLKDTDNNPLTPTSPVYIGDDIKGYLNMGANIRYTSKNDVYVMLNISNIFDTEIRYPADELTLMQKGLIGMDRVVTATVGAKF